MSIKIIVMLIIVTNMHADPAFVFSHHSDISEKQDKSKMDSGYVEEAKAYKKIIVHLQPVSKRNVFHDDDQCQEDSILQWCMEPEAEKCGGTHCKGHLVGGLIQHSHNMRCLWPRYSFAPLEPEPLLKECLEVFNESVP